MIRMLAAAALTALLPLATAAQESIGLLTLQVADAAPEAFVIVQGTQGTNPGSRYSRLGEDVVMTIVGVRGDTAREPGDAEATVELQFTIDATTPEVRTGAVLSYSTRDAEGTPMTRGGTVEIALADLVVEDEAVTASGTFVAQLPPDGQQPGGEVEGSFNTTMKSRAALD